MIIGVTFNLCLLGYFKYTDFFITNFNFLFRTDYHLKNILLPLAISFFTFQQIGYLIDTYRNQTDKSKFLPYCLFVACFPQLIAGPIVKHREMMPQYLDEHFYKFNYKNVAFGLTLFLIGLFKKVILADGISVYAIPVFEAAENAISITFFEAWCGALSYSFQLYFDFSGYSDMAIGIAKIFNISLPINFFSPYKVVNIIEFWRHWHITLSRFLRDYLYFPLGGNRKGTSRRYLNIIITMLLGGLWHGAGWTFVAWGALHGFYLVINHLWHAIRVKIGYGFHKSSTLGLGISYTITFASVVIAWVFFRAESLRGAFTILKGMIGLNRIAGFEGNYLGSIHSAGVFIWIAFAFSIVFLLPNTAQILKESEFLSIPKSAPQGISLKIEWKSSLLWMLFMACIGIISISRLHKFSEFLYFNF